MIQIRLQEESQEETALSQSEKKKKIAFSIKQHINEMFYRFISGNSPLTGLISHQICQHSLGYLHHSISVCQYKTHMLLNCPVVTVVLFSPACSSLLLSALFFMFASACNLHVMSALTCYCWFSCNLFLLCCTVALLLLLPVFLYCPDILT